VLALLTLPVTLFLSYSDLRPWNERKTDLLVLSKRGDLIISALSEYHKSEGKYPDSLKELIPQYIDELPSEKMEGIRHHDFEYVVASEDSSFKGYKVSVYTPSAFMNWDELFYYPSQDYPDSIHNQRVERLGSWAYLHE